MIVIKTSETIATLIPLIWHSLDPDLPLDDTLPKDLRTHLKKLLLRTFKLIMTEDQYELQWVIRLKKDPVFLPLLSFQWTDIEVLDTEGTFIISFEDKT